MRLNVIFVAAALVVTADGCSRRNPRFGDDFPDGTKPSDASALCTPGTAGCSAGCSATAPCTAGFQCLSGVCTGAGPALYWRLDEASGTVVADSSGNGFDGSCVGESTLPTVSTSVPPTLFSNLHSRSFEGGTARPAIRSSGAVAALGIKPYDELTLSVWYQATTADDASGGDPLNLGDVCLLRVKPARLEFAKRVSATEGMYFKIAQLENPADHLDGRWHHLAGVASSTEIRLYLDGILRGTTEVNAPFLLAGQDLWVGRTETNALPNAFRGQVDEVRVYHRALSDQEILAIAQGKL